MHSDQTLTICSPQIGIDPESNLGGEVSDRETLKALARLGVRVLIPLPRGQRYESVENWEIIPTPRHRWKYYEYNLIFRRAVARLIKEGRKIHVIRAHAAYSTGPGLVGLARRCSIPCHLHYHHWERHFLRNLIERLTLWRYDLITTPSDYSRRHLIERYGLRNRVEVLYPGVNAAYGPSPADPDLRARFGGKQVLLFVGVLVARKNVSFLLRVFRRLRTQRREDLVLVLVGDGPVGQTLRNEAAQMDLSASVIFAGRIGEREKMDYYRLCDVFVFPSLVEGFGMAPAEAMAFGKPVVASNTSSIPEVIEDGQTGFLADPTDESGFVEKIARLLDSPELRVDMGRAGQQRVDECFDFHRTAEKLVDLYRQLK
jgi:glycosyltransferase involved in cell wall biosynthesis